MENDGIIEEEYKFNLVFEEAPDEYKIYNLEKTKFKKIMDNSNLIKYVNNQEQLGSCVSNAVSVSLLDKEMRPSRLFIYYNARDNKYDDKGVSIYKCLKTLSDFGYCSEDNHPYIIKEFHKTPTLECYEQGKTKLPIKFLSIPQEKQFIKYQIYSKRLVIFGCKVYKSFMKPKDGIIKIPDDTDTYIGRHCMLIVGCSGDTKEFKVLNSFGDKWGDKGYCYFPYEYILNKELCSDFFVIV